jgi:tRNA pseudouridine38-40 synthase
LNDVSSLYLGDSLDVHKMKAAVALLPRYNDYRPFCKTPDTYKNTIVNVTSANLYVDDRGDRIRFQISANRFLSRMIRIVMSKVLDVGRGTVSVDEFENYLVTKEIPKTIEPAFPQGLFLSRVIYPYLDIPPRAAFSAILQNREDTWVPV